MRTLSYTNGLSILASTLLALAACGRMATSTLNEVGASCGLARDQWGSLNPPMNRQKVGTVWIHPDFTDTERATITRSVNSWNTFSSPNLGRAILEVKVGVYHGLESGSHLTSCQFAAGDDSSFAILRETDSTKWSEMGMTDANPGFTIRCKQGNTLDRQVILLNPSLIPEVQLGSVVVHELGHALGLDHSCTSEEATDTFASCQSLGSEHPYRQAVMFPTLQVPANLTPQSIRRGGVSSALGTEIKEDLQRNDMDRASCLYRSNG